MACNMLAEVVFEISRVLDAKFQEVVQAWHLLGLLPVLLFLAVQELEELIVVLGVFDLDTLVFLIDLHIRFLQVEAVVRQPLSLLVEVPVNLEFLKS